VIPSRLLIWLTLAWFGSGVLAAFFPGVNSLWLPASLFFGIVIALDALLSLRRPRIVINRNMPHNLSVSTWVTVELTVHNQGDRMCGMDLFDLHPGDFESQGLPVSLRVQPGRHARFDYRVRPGRRGDSRFSGCHLQLDSPLGLWKKRRVYPNEEIVKVYPNYAEVAKYALLATDNRLSLLGIKHRRRRGQGLEFHQLREFREGDSLRQIDWKATSRHRKLISREFQDERDQQLIFLLDCGRRMRTEDEHYKHFDQCLNATLLLSYVALRQGDSVSLLAFGGQQRRLKASKGVAYINTILNQTYDLEATLEASDYTGAAQELLVFQRKRSLVCIMTNARDEDQSSLLAAVQLLRTRHLVVVANLQESVLGQITDTPVGSYSDALRYAAAVNYLDTRRQNHKLLTASGVMALNVTAQELPVAMVNKYIDIKQNNLL